MRTHWPSWRLRKHKNGTVSLFPSLWVSDVGCGSHFWVIKNSVLWSKSEFERLPTRLSLKGLRFDPPEQT